MLETMAAGPEIHPTRAGTREAVDRARASGRAVVLVPTMGALHEGHLAHVARARELATDAFVVVSIFVNPLQFGAGEDFDRYPRTLEADVARLADAGADAVFAPSVEEMYPAGQPVVTVSAGPVGATFEGAVRPGHFDGALTVVAKLFGIVRPDAATFGEKDAQQLWLVERMVADLDLPVRIVPIPIVREADGLAMSSRNRYLSDRERRVALTLSRTLEAAQSAAVAGIDAVIAAAQSVYADELDVDYFAVVDPATFRPVPDGYHGPVIALVAARVGSTRLIDNARFRLG